MPVVVTPSNKPASLRGRIAGVGEHHEVNGSCVLYIMSRDQRVQDNHALLAAQSHALTLHVPLVVQFHLCTTPGVRAREHFAFMLAGLEEVAADLEKLRIAFVLTHGDAIVESAKLSKAIQPAAIYMDFNPLTGPRLRAKSIAKAVQIPCFVVDTHNIIPAWVASRSEEFAAHTFRPKVHRLLEEHLLEPVAVTDHPFHLRNPLANIPFADAYTLISNIPACGTNIDLQPGTSAATKHLRRFVKQGLQHYANGRNNIANDQQSGFSPYLHFGQISALRIALEVMYTTNQRPLLFDQAKMADSDGIDTEATGMNALFEEMIVRKELADNFCLYNPNYRNLDAARDWARQTLKSHENDPRTPVYDQPTLEQATTHDDAWNAAQRQLTRSGKMHGYMRMYWAKKILEWSPSPEQAIETAIYLNDHYSIDGGDPNGYTGILWSIAGIHDRPWFERPIYGKIRYMNESGLRRKFDVDTYIQQWS